MDDSPHPRPHGISLPRRGAAIGLALILVGLMTWAAVHLGGGIAVGEAETTAQGRDWDKVLAAASGDPLVLAAIQTRANENRVMRGDADAIAGFETSQPIGASTALPAQGDPVR